MAMSRAMKLADWLKQEDMNASDLARAMGLKYPTNIYRYLRGRVPPPDVMRAISDATGGNVTANDFIHAERL